jgi:hypothetical protein
VADFLAWVAGMKGSCSDNAIGNIGNDNEATTTREHDSGMAARPAGNTPLNGPRRTCVDAAPA